jgi:hypothetical protein
LKEQQHLWVPFFGLVVLGCFFVLGLFMFAGCVTIRQQSSLFVKGRQETSKLRVGGGFWRKLILAVG